MSDELTRQGHPEIAAQIKRYVEQMPRPLTVNREGIYLMAHAP
jgi:hypothetical protein